MPGSRGVLLYQTGATVQDETFKGRIHAPAISEVPSDMLPCFRKSNLDETIRAMSCDTALEPIIPPENAPNEFHHYSIMQQQAAYFRALAAQPINNPGGESKQQFTAPSMTATPDQFSSTDTEETRAESPCKKKWSDEDKEKHSKACKSKARLTLEEKLEIIRLFECSDPRERKSQRELAVMYDKSRMTISTILRPENIEWYRKLAASGVRRQAKRYKRSGHPDFEGQVFEAIGSGLKPATKAEVADAAVAVARREGITDFEASNNWCTRFIQQHEISVAKCSPRVNASGSSGQTEIVPLGLKAFNSLIGQHGSLAGPVGDEAVCRRAAELHPGPGDGSPSQTALLRRAVLPEMASMIMTTSGAPQILPGHERSPDMN